MLHPQHVDLDLDVINKDYKHDEPPPYLKFEEIRNTPFLDGDSSEYFCSIMRLTILTGNTLPVFIPRVVIQNSNTPIEVQHSMLKVPQNTTIYSVSLEYNYMDIDYVQTCPILYTPEDKTAPLPAPPNTIQDSSIKYYNVYTYKNFIDTINAAFRTAFEHLNKQLPKTSGKKPP